MSEDEDRIGELEDEISDLNTRVDALEDDVLDRDKEIERLQAKLDNIRDEAHY